ncbi:hypothetical protein BC830DRAFT_669379 [Chytriomyces sp. MP71]|nr:hypothetical protein BC830DRAFT_669379 [Chytriomyces sp. MP71]
MMDSTGAIWTIQRIWSNALQKCTNVPALSVNRTFWYTTTTTTSTTTSKTSTTSPTSSTTSSSSTSTTTTTTVSLAANIQAVIGNGFFGGLQKAVRTVSVTSLTSSMTKSQLSSRTPAANSSTYTSTSTSSTTTLSSTTTSKSAFTSSTRSILISTPPSSISTVTSTITTASQPIISPPNLILSNPGVNYVYGGVLNESLAPEKKAESESYTSTFFSHMAEALTSTSAIPANKTSIGQTNGFAFLLLAYLFYV